jgi:murein DD-endopeptidase MepM/ murein hydrolase activator NlpD
MNIAIGGLTQNIFSAFPPNISPQSLAANLLQKFSSEHGFDAAGVAGALGQLQESNPELSRAVAAEIERNISPINQGQFNRELAFFEGTSRPSEKQPAQRAGDRNSADNKTYPADIAAAVARGATRVGPLPGWQEPAVKGDIGPNGNPYSDGRYSIDGKEKYRIAANGKGKAHQGIDIPAKMGDPVYAAASGIITEVRTGSGYGMLVVIDHKDGTSTMYAHLSKQSVKVGQTVTIGQVIGNVGVSGNGTNKGEHLHFETMQTPPNSKIWASSMPNINPTEWILAGGW